MIDPPATHILFGDSAAGSLKFAFRKKRYNMQQIISFSDIFSIGPIEQLHTELGIKRRGKWLKNCLTDKYDNYSDYEQGFIKTVQQIRAISEGAYIYIWCYENADEQTGLRYVVYLLQGKKVKITMVNTWKIYDELYNQGDTICYPHKTGAMPARELKQILEQNKALPLTDDERDELEKQWIALAETKETLRIWKNDVIECVSEDYFDELFTYKFKELYQNQWVSLALSTETIRDSLNEMIETVSPEYLHKWLVNQGKALHQGQDEYEFIKAPLLIGAVLSESDQEVGDAFLQYRLKKLIDKGVFKVKGNLKSMRYYSVKLVESTEG